MRYQESKEQSAELLRQVIALMGQHDAPFNPISFTVWYEYVSGMNSWLTQAVALAMASEARLSGATLLRLYQEGVAEVDPSTMYKIANELQQTMAGMGEQASKTAQRAGQFDEQLQGLTTALGNSDAAGVTTLISQAREGTALMRSSVGELEQQVTAGRHEIARLQNELVRVRDEVLLDPLTQILNRRGFDEKLAVMIAQAPEPGCSHGLVMLDIDFFKQVNDTHGHVMGDRVLQAIGDVLRSCAAEKAYSVARYGGEEFAILMPDASLEQAQKMAELVRQRTRAMRIRDRRTKEVVLSVTVSGGVAVMQLGDDKQRWIHRADSALYQSKKAGRDRVTCA
ncbi:GGDEF domain-containing protein [Rhodoferax sp. PAMC 29310]|uniref:GGDEF domain-containing protein n=1 Tax=Rhodoferax sp. PAMC 29310 TaxID=2822760 RepID=UPI001B325DD3|nr:GGDEF domain-containing protein [Rhodoferax sp. PAMC 29310]